MRPTTSGAGLALVARGLIVAGLVIKLTKYGNETADHVVITVPFGNFYRHSDGPGRL